MSSVSSSTQSALWTNQWAPIQISSKKPIELKQEVKNIFGDDIYMFFTPFIQGAENINEQRLFRILNGIIDQGQEGEKLLSTLKTYLEETNLKVNFFTYNDFRVQFLSEIFLRKINNAMLDNRSAHGNSSAHDILKQGGFSIPIILDKESEIEKSFERMFVFDGQRITSIPFDLEIIKKEAYTVSHEISHAPV